MLATFLLIIGVVALMVGLTALYVAGEFAAVSARKTRIRQMADDGNRLAQRMVPIVEDPRQLDNYIAASQVGITLASLVLGIFGQNQIAPLVEPWIARLPLERLSFLDEETAAAGVAAALVLFVLTCLTVVLGELVPKSLAIQYPERVALATVLPMRWSADWLLKPLIVVLNGSGMLILRLLGASHGASHTHVHSPEEIEILVSESAEGGLLDADERQLLHNAFRIGELTAGETMIPRPRLAADSVDTPAHDLLRLAADSAYTRIPLFEGDIDHIVGFVHLKELFRLHRSDPQAPARTILRSAPYVPETMPITEVWTLLNEEKSYLAIVFDEYGGTAGIITREDLIEELFGELQDEFDQESDPVARGDGHLVVRGDTLVEALNDQFGLDLPTEVAHTIGGLVLDELGRPAAIGDEVEVNAVRLKVKATAGRSITELTLTPPEGALER